MQTHSSESAQSLQTNLILMACTVYDNGLISLQTFRYDIRDMFEGVIFAPFMFA